jgi:Stage II sporulation protein E (SpoIIE)/GAF domain
MVGDSTLVQPTSGGPDLAALATFTLDQAGRLDSWSRPAERLFSRPAAEVLGRHVCDVLLIGPGHRDLIDRALADVAAGQVWTGQVAGEAPGAALLLRCEPCPGPAPGVLVIARLSAGASTARDEVPGAASGLLAEAAARIGSTLDVTRTADEAVAVAVPAFADGAVIYLAERLLADEFGGPAAGASAVARRVAVRLAGRPDGGPAGPLPIGEVLAFGPGTPHAQVMSGTMALRFDQLDAETAERIGRHPAGRAAAARFTSYLAVPLLARGVVLGCVTFARTPGRPPFGPDDAELASGLADRAASCLDNARRYGQERRTALALQRGLLPARPQVPPGLQVAHWYRPVGANMVGGDWYDIVPLSGGRAVLIVGDVMGHGPEAAAVMVQLRTAAHTLADLELPPAAVLRRLDRLAAGLPGAPFATCVYAVLDPAESCCLIAEAGHLPPLLTHADGRTDVLDLPPGLPLGLGGEAFQPTQISLPPGATLALYTDGLVESRTRPLGDGMAALADALSSALAPARPAVLDAACTAVTTELMQLGEDDITLVLARVSPA